MKILHCEQPFGVYDDRVPVTLLTDSSVSRNHRPLFLPPHHDGWVMTLAPAVRVSRLGKFVAPKFARRYYDAVTLVARLRPAGLTLPASAVDTAFDSSVIVGDWMELEPGAPVPPLSLESGVNLVDVKLDTGVFDRTLAALSAYFMVKHGDIIIPGDFSAQLGVAVDTELKVNLNGSACLDFRIK